MRFHGFGFIACLFALLVPGANAAVPLDPDVILSAGDLGLLKDLRWGMSVAEAKRALPSLALLPDPEIYDPPLGSIGTAAIPYLGCNLEFTLTFFQDQLDSGSVKDPSGLGCHADVERRLTARFGDPNVPVPCPNVISRRWSNGATRISYDFGCYGSRAGLEFKFEEYEDRRGRATYISSHANCQSVIAEILPSTSADGASDIIVEYDATKLGCGYPPISVRLQEEGIVTLRVRISADGPVLDVEPETSSGKPAR